MMIDATKLHTDPKERERAEDMVGLLTPVVKGFLTEEGHRLAGLSQQVFGGHGYIEEWGMSQFVRDARITMIYEGRVHDATCGEGRKGFELKILNKKDLRYARFPPRPSDDHAKPAFRSGQDTIGDPRNHAGRSRKWPNR